MLELNINTDIAHSIREEATEKTDEEVIESGTETEETIVIVESGGDLDHHINEHRGATTRVTHILQAETTGPGSEKIGMAAEAEVNETNASGTETEAHADVTMANGRHDAIEISSKIDEAVVETEEIEAIEAIEADETLAVKSATSLPHKREAARRARRRRPRRGSQRQT